MRDTVATSIGTEALRPRKAAKDDQPAIVETLALSFFDDPVVGWIIPDDARRRELNPALFGAIVESYLAHDETYDVEAGVGAAVWAPPHTQDDEELQERVGASVAENTGRMAEVLGLLDETHPSDPHYYLFLLGTRPRWQGRGIGSALMRPVLDACDREGVPAYLEATSERNRALYLRHGFKVTGEIRLPGGPPLWPMWREPE